MSEKKKGHSVIQGAFYFPRGPHTERGQSGFSRYPGGRLSIGITQNVLFYCSRHNIRLKVNSIVYNNIFNNHYV